MSNLKRDCRGFLPGANPEKCVWCGVSVAQHSRPSEKEQPSQPVSETPRKQERVRTHWEGCWRDHHGCAIAWVERLQRELSAANARAEEFKAERNALLDRYVRQRGKSRALASSGKK